MVFHRSMRPSHGTICSAKSPMPPHLPDTLPIIVADTTPISELAKVGRLDLLRDVYTRVIVPDEVYEEVTTGTHPAVEAVRSALWIERRSVADQRAVAVMHAAT